MPPKEWIQNLPNHEKRILSREYLEHIPLEGRTTDPEAADFDEACEIFLAGVKLARSGNYRAATPQIATAFLLDSRSINYVHFIPERNSDLKMLCLEADLMFYLSQAMVLDLNRVSYGGHVIRILLATLFGRTSDGQTFLSEGVRSVNYLLQRITEDPSPENPNNPMAPLGKCLTRPNLYFHRGAIHMYVGNRLKAARDLTKALEIDLRFLTARDARASLWARLNLQTSALIVKEYKIVVNQAHPDNRKLEYAYGRLAHYIMCNPALGTLKEALTYYGKSLKASKRQAILYGENKCDPEAAIFQHYCKDYISNHEWSSRREQMDYDSNAAAYMTARLDDLGLNQPDQKMGHACTKCGKTALELGHNLSKCSQCIKVSYCSRKCQKSDWKAHKVFCITIPISMSTDYEVKR